MDAVIVNTVLVLVAAVFLLPMVWLVLSAFDPAATLVLHLPEGLSIGNFRDVLNVDQTFRPLWNSALLSFGTGILTLAVGVLAAYPLSRYQSRFNKPFLYTVIFGTCLPITAIMVPVYALFVSLNLVDSTIGTILFLSASSLPIAIWMAKNFMDSIPVSLEEAAWVDGASAFRTLRVIVLPLMKPGLAVVFLYTFIGAWGNFFVPFVLLLDPAKQPAAVAIYSFFGQHGSVDYGPLAAFSLVYSLPVIVLYIAVQRLMGGSGALAGAIKG
ncbi:carbohydrate ABC transporter permease [Herbiconiux moechotypicola]|nr:carbohydrate ABC transporter permease [Herbiconiux moechotypicola]